MEDKTDDVVKLIQVSAILIRIYCGYTTLKCFIWIVGYDFSVRLLGQFKMKIPILYALFITHVRNHDYLTEISMWDKSWMHGQLYSYNIQLNNFGKQTY